jgi:hypothetical protein
MAEQTFTTTLKRGSAFYEFKIERYVIVMMMNTAVASQHIIMIIITIHLDVGG